MLRLHSGAASRAEAAQSPGSQKAGSGVAGHLSSSAFPEGARFSRAGLLRAGRVRVRWWGKLRPIPTRPLTWAAVLATFVSRSSWYLEPAALKSRAFSPSSLKLTGLALAHLEQGLRPGTPSGLPRGSEIPGESH